MADVPSPETGLEEAAKRDPKAQSELQHQERLDELYLLAAMFITALGIVFWHHVTPENAKDCAVKGAWCLQWLNEAQLHRLQSILFSGGVGAFLTGIGQRYFFRGRDRDAG